MILEDATFEAFGYYPSGLTHGSIKPVIAICEDCGTFKKTTKHDYHYLCNSCSKIVGEADKGEKNHNWKPKVNCICEICGNKFEVFPYLVKNGYAKFCGRKCFGIAKSEIRGEKHSCYGRTYTEEHKTNMSKNHADFSGKNNPAWLNGISFEPYCQKFNRVFKDYIREKFGFKCFLCPITQEENGAALSVHHVNYNKDCGCDGDLTCQFIPLCKSCHSKTNTNRDYWQKYITDKLHNSIIGWNV